MVERRTPNPYVGGSSPSGPASSLFSGRGVEAIALEHCGFGSETHSLSQRCAFRAAESFMARETSDGGIHHHSDDCLCVRGQSYLGGGQYFWFAARFANNLIGGGRGFI